MIGFITLLSLYLLVLVTGWLLGSRLELRSSLQKAVMTFTFGAAQLLLSIQILSLFYQLNGTALLALNALITALAVYLLRRRKRDAGDETRGDSSHQFAGIADFLRKHPWESVIVALTLAVVVWFVVLAFLMFPMTDAYHFAMPLFWKQHGTILPYPVCNPRLVAVVFAAEALAFPGQLYMKTDALFPILSGIATVFTILIIAAQARQFGASLFAAVSAGAVWLGYGATVVSLFGGSPDLLLAAMWFAASLLLLVESRVATGIHLPSLVCSVFCLVMACGAKNVVLLHFPWYALSAAVLFGRLLLSKRTVVALVLTGFFAALSSGLLWSYASNLVWFGNAKGHAVLSETVSVEMTPTAIWTRISRGVTSSFLDPIWLPQKYQQSYKGLFRTMVRLSGGKETLPEDNEYYSLPDESLRPGRGLGILGIAVLAPSLIVGGIYVTRTFLSRRRRGEQVMTIVVLVLVTIGSFLTFYVVLRTQSIGVTRLMLSCLVAGAPLSGLLLANRGFRLVAFPVLLVSLLAYSVYGLGMAARRDSLASVPWLVDRISRLQRDRTTAVEYQWAGEPPGDVQIRESYSAREYDQIFLSRVPTPAVIGVIGGTNTDDYFLFGAQFSNKVVPLLDARNPQRLLAAPNDVQYIILQDFDIDAHVLEKYPGFRPCLKVRQNGKTILTAFGKKSGSWTAAEGIDGSLNNR